MSYLESHSRFRLRRNWVGALLSLLISLPGIAFAEPESAAKEPAVTPKGVAAIDAFIAEAKVDKLKRNWKTSLPKPPQVSFDSSKRVFWTLQTNVGEIVIKLMPDVAPMHVSSTIYLTQLGFYDDVKFHRVIPGFMAQGGDPTGTGRGGPGYKYAGEFSRSVKHDRPGLLSMANAGPGTDGSQFFLTFVPTPHLDGKHTLFGEVVGSKKALGELESFASPSGRPTKLLIIEKASIQEK